MSTHHLSRRASDGPISAIYGGRLANDKVQERLAQSSICARAPRKENVEPIVSANTAFLRHHILHLITRWTASVDHTDWSIPRSAAKLMYRCFQQCTGLVVERLFVLAPAKSPSPLYPTNFFLFFSFLLKFGVKD